MRFSSSSTLSVGATQLARLGICGILLRGALGQILQKVKAGDEFAETGVSVNHSWSLQIGVVNIELLTAYPNVARLATAWSPWKSRLTVASAMAGMPGGFAVFIGDRPGSTLRSTPLASMNVKLGTCGPWPGVP